MDIEIKVNANKSVYVKNSMIAYHGEKNVNTLSIDVPIENEKVKWYLLIEKKDIIPFINKRLSIDERLTNYNGIIHCNIVGTDAYPGNDIRSGSICFISDKFILNVKEV